MPAEPAGARCGRRAQSLEAGPGRAHGTAGLGKHRDGAASVPDRARRGQRRALHARGRRIHLVLRGELEIALDGEEYLLKPGDSFYFESATPHRWKNPGRKETWVLWVNTPPTF